MKLPLNGPSSSQSPLSPKSDVTNSPLRDNHYHMVEALQSKEIIRSRAEGLFETGLRFACDEFLDLSETKLRRAIDSFAEIDDAFGVCKVEFQLGLHLANQDRFEEAFPILLRSAEVLISCGLHVEIAVHLSTICTKFTEKMLPEYVHWLAVPLSRALEIDGRVSQALEIVLKACDYSSRNQQPDLLAASYSRRLEIESGMLEFVIRFAAREIGGFTPETY